MRSRMIVLFVAACLLLFPAGCKNTDAANTPTNEVTVAPTYRPVDPSQLLMPDAAGRIALEDAGLSASDVVGLHSAYDIEDGRQTIVITFRQEHIQYEYVLDAVSGEIIRCNKGSNIY